MHAIHWKKQAIKDLIKIGQFISKDSPTNAGKMIDLIESKVLPLATHPRIGRPGHKRGTYELVAHEHYLIIYRVLSTKVEVLRIKHTAQQWHAE
ncbi:type II toxin-antitoxin system RelE/ParE family toxin [Massilia sp. CCM 9210]|uniref:type II toxin-antitoxin system RelE/ParE family toxin n=1 Tax=Massilia scottii TaxID=3057166 RepID=UPI0027965651|nr:type II toxin-antitoxin system RelE/ParE family toxin [Massilia sp. CCM 9210]MDQ1814835.1 type II toxin-antitoxin system RelE/ParE family toxin [Massilia sp. CCM 9210]